MATVLILTIAAVAILYPIISFFWDSNGLRKFPSPSLLASTTPFWRMYHNYHLNQFEKIHQAHQCLGSHVRIAPNHVSISAPEAVETVYGHCAKFLKDVWYDGGAGAARSMADTRSKTEHQSKRKRMAHLFSAKNLATMEPVVVDRVTALLIATSHAATKSETMNVRRFVNYFTIDVITYLLFGKSTRCLEKGNDMVPAKSKSCQVYRAPLIDSLHAGMRVSVPIGYAPGVMSVSRALVPYHPLSKQGRQFEDIVYYHVQESYENVAKPDQLVNADFGDGGFFRQLTFDKRGARVDISFNELLAECSGMINAGSDTTSTMLSNAVYLLSQSRHEHILQRLRTELAPIFDATTSPIPDFDSLSRAVFLRACIDETLRLRPSSAFGLPREVPTGGRWIAGQFVAEGVSVSVPTYSLLHNEDIFDKPDEYIPGRWIDAPDEDKVRMKKWFLPFSSGPRACIGRNIAYYEMTLVVATLVHYFDFKFADPTVDGNYRVLERLNANPDELMMIPTQRVAKVFNKNA
ncbi:hypothetical protein QQX98_004366 [Neonectria punicea]|uniref:Uncharacterized protein n=1 Tax=Neonectria punicea TaxID=979145 RepID=A0ABR1H9L9_9HYPO